MPGVDHGQRAVQRDGERPHQKVVAEAQLRRADFDLGAGGVDARLEHFVMLPVTAVVPHRLHAGLGQTLVM